MKHAAWRTALLAAAALAFLAGVNAAAADRASFLEDAHYYDNYFQREFTFALQGEEILVRFQPGSSTARGAALAARLGLTTLHPVQAYHFHAHYRVPAGADVLEVAAAAARQDGVLSAFPVLVDGDGYRKVVVGHELTVRFRDGLDDTACRKLLAGMGSKVAEDHWTPGYYTITVPQGMTLFQAIRAYNDMEAVRFAEFSSVGYDDLLFTPNDPQYPNQQNLNNTGQVTTCSACTPYADHDINASSAWDITRGQPNVIVAIIDTGADLDHPDLAANFLPRGSEDWDFADPADSVPEDVDGHGTSTSGIAAAVTNNGAGVAGIANLCRIMPLRIDLSSGMNQNRADAINYAASRRADFDGMVLSNSWRMSSGTYTAVYDAIQNAKTLGCVVCFASGNQNVQPVDVPSDSPYCISVGAVSPCDERKSLTSCDGENFWGSSYGADMDVMAPGVLIHTTALGGGYTETFNGTSSACPHVAGVAALILSLDPSLTPTQVEEVLEGTAQDLGPAGFDNETAWGRIDALAALEFIGDLGTLAGTVTVQGSGAPLEATVQAVRQGSGATSTTTSSPLTGDYTLNLVADTYDVTASAFGYVPATAAGVVIVTDLTTDQDFALAAAATGTIQGTVRNTAGDELSGVEVEILDTPVSPVYTNGAGFYTITLPGGASYDLRFSLASYGTTTLADVPVTQGGTTTRDVTLPDWPSILIWEPDPTPLSGAAMQSALASLGWDSVLTDDLLAYGSDLSGYQAIFVLVGIYSNNYVFGSSSAEETALVAYLQGGGNLYLEGGDIWCYDSYPTTLRPYFHYLNEGDGSADLSTVNGVAATFTAGMSFSYTGENSWIDQLGAGTGAYEIFVNPSDAYGCGVAYDAGSYRTLALSYEFGGLVDGASTQAALMQAYLDFFGLELPQPDTVGVALACTPPSGTLPFTVHFSATLSNLYAGFTRILAGRIEATLASGQTFSNWRSGYTNVGPSGSFNTQFNVNFPALGALVGNNVFRLLGQDVTASPFNQPPYPASGDTDSDTATVAGMAP